jgi:hypothetical protein
MFARRRRIYHLRISFHIMSTQKHLLVALLAGISLLSSVCAAGQPSKISNFKGTSNGVCTLTTGAGLPPYSGPARGSFSASNAKEAGTFNLTSAVSNGVDTVPVFESYRFKKRSVSYSLSIGSFVGGSGAGTAQIGKRVISYVIPVVVGNVPYTLQGTIRQTAKRLIVSEVLSTSGGSASFTYNLKRRVRK